MKRLVHARRGGGARRSPRRARPRARAGPGSCRPRRRCRGGRGSRRRAARSRCRPRGGAGRRGRPGWGRGRRACRPPRRRRVLLLSGHRRAWLQLPPPRRSTSTGRTSCTHGEALRRRRPRERTQISCSPERPPKQRRSSFSAVTQIQYRARHRCGRQGAVHYTPRLMSFAFSLEKHGRPRARGRLTTPHGVVETPAFMPVGTRGGGEGGDAARPGRGGARRSSSPTPIT